MASPITYLTQTLNELKQVQWPSKNDVLKLTGIVIVLSIIVGLYIGTIDYLLTLLVDFLLR